MGDNLRTIFMIIFSMLFFIIYYHINEYGMLKVQNDNVLNSIEIEATNSLLVGESRVSDEVVGDKLATDLISLFGDLDSSLDKSISISNYEGSYFITVTQENVNNVYKLGGISA